MRKLMLSLLGVLGLLLTVTLPCHAQSADVPDAAKHEIARLGSHVELTGTIRSGLMAAAFSPPADDSCKWYLTLVGMPGEPGFETLKATIANDKNMRPWVNAADPSRSATHYHVVNLNDSTQAEWLKGVMPALQKFGHPAVVIQAPRNGQFGDHKATVKMIHGPLTGEQLAAKIKQGIKEYITALETPIQEGMAREAIGVQPPFRTPQPQAAPTPPVAQVPFDWPAVTPASLTVEQIRAACPGATPEFVLDTFEDKPTDVGLVKLKWQLYQKIHEQPKPKAAEPEPRPLAFVPPPCTDPVVPPRLLPMPAPQPQPQQEPEPKHMPEHHEVEASPVHPSEPAPTVPHWWLAAAIGGSFGMGYVFRWLKTLVDGKRAENIDLKRQLSEMSQAPMRVMLQSSRPIGPSPVGSNQPSKPVATVAKKPATVETNEEMSE